MLEKMAICRHSTYLHVLVHLHVVWAARAAIVAPCELHTIFAVAAATRKSCIHMLAVINDVTNLSLARCS